MDAYRKVLGFGKKTIKKYYYYASHAILHTHTIIFYAVVRFLFCSNVNQTKAKMKQRKIGGKI